MKCGIDSRILAGEMLAFYDWLETNYLGSSCICLWFALLHTWHKAGCPEEFAVARSTLEGKTGLKRDAISEARNQLQQLGRITWRKRAGRQASIYKFVSFIPTQYGCVGNNVTTPAANPAQYPPQIPPQPPPISSRSNNNSFNLLDNTPPPTNATEKPTQTAEQGFCVGNNVTTPAANPAQYPPQTEDNPYNPFKHYERLFGLLRPLAIEQIRDYLDNGLEERLVCLTMDRSHENGAYNWNYSLKILDRCVIEKVHTVDEFLKKEEQHRIMKANRKPKGGNQNGTGGSHFKQGDNDGDPYGDIPTTQL